ncbi:MAG TPA: NAD(P)H-binding protein [Actinomycetota bacterium]|jgi:NADH dehydrogenase
MPVVITGASGLVGPHAVRALAAASPEVRAVVRRPASAAALRALGAKVAVGELSDQDTLAAVMRGAHTVVHLAGGLDVPDDRAFEAANLTTTEDALHAAVEAKVRRFVLLSFPGASPDSPNPYLRAKGLAERAVAASGLEFAVIRSNHVLGPGGAWVGALVRQARSRPALVVAPGTQTMAPVFVEDVAAILAAADDRSGLASGTWSLDGPERVTADELTDLVAGRHRHAVHVRPATLARLARIGRRPVSTVMLEVLAADALGDAPDAASEFGIELTPLRAALERSLP